MRNLIVTAALAVVATSLVACAGVKTRTSDEWRSEIGQGFAAHTGDLKACYDSAGLKTKVSIVLQLVADKQKADGGSNPVTVESFNTADASPALIDCVKHAASSIVIRPEDKRRGSGSWVVTFDPNVAPSISSIGAWPAG